jgi:hypothetical protein
MNSTILLDSLNRQATLREERLRERYDGEHAGYGSLSGEKGVELFQYSLYSVTPRNEP